MKTATLTPMQIMRLKQRYFSKSKNVGYEHDEEMDAIIIYATKEVWKDGIYYSLETGEIVKTENIIKKIRKKYGHAPLPGTGTGIIVYRKNKRDYEVLLQQRGDFITQYGLPGGAIEYGEIVEEAAARELKEETGLVVNAKDLNLLKVYSGPKHITKYPNKDIVYNINIIYTVNFDKCKVTSINNKHETLGIDWFNVNKLKILIETDRVFSNNISILEDIIKWFKVKKS